MCHLDTAQCRILKDSGRFLVKNTKGVRVNGDAFYIINIEICLHAAAPCRELQEGGVA